MLYCREAGGEKMKKLFALLVAMTCIIGTLTGCGTSGTPSNETEITDTTDTTETTDATDSAQVTDFKVGAIYINSKNDTAGYTFAHHNGITTAMKNLGLSPETNLVIVDEVPEDKEAVLSAIDTLVGEGCNIVFGISFGYIDAMEEAAAEYQDVIFSHATGYKSNETNFNNYFGRIYQARYLAGVAAGLKSLEMENNNLGYVAAHGTAYAETCSGINAFALGAQSVNPEATLHVNVIGNWADEELEKSLAQDLVDTYKCGVIAQHCDSAQPQLVAADNSIFGCGYNSDMTAEAPSAHLTAPVWNWDVYYQLAMETAMNTPAEFIATVGNYYGGLKENFVDISPITENCSENTAAYLDAVRALIISGEWDVFSGVKLSFNVNEGVVEVVQTDAALVDNTGAEIVAAGGESVDDGVICGSMNYYVEGVIEH